MSVTTKKGDGGFTGLPGAGKTEARETGNTAGSYGAADRVSKADPRIECLGALDELDASLALCEVSLKASGMETTAALTGEIRHILFSVVMPAAAGISSTKAAGPDTDTLEKWIEERERNNPVRGFVRHWTTQAAACLNMARTICRRAERAMTAAHASAPADKTVEWYGPLLPWINRLSDLLFVLAVETETGAGTKTKTGTSTLPPGHGTGGLQ